MSDIVRQDKRERADEEIRRYVVLLSDMWTSPREVQNRVDDLYQTVRDSVLHEVLDFITDPVKRKNAGGGFGWETAAEVVKNMINEASPRLCNCGHPEKQHQGPEGLGGAQCLVCTEDGERSWRHPYTPHDCVWVTALDGNNNRAKDAKGNTWEHCGVCGANKVRG